jgi:hypothetical protein
MRHYPRLSSFAGSLSTDAHDRQLRVVRRVGAAADPMRLHKSLRIALPWRLT